MVGTTWADIRKLTPSIFGHLNYRPDPIGCAPLAVRTPLAVLGRGQTAGHFGQLRRIKEKR